MAVAPAIAPPARDTPSNVRIAGGVGVAEILGQAIAQAMLGSEQVEHGVNPRDFGLFMPGEIPVQLFTQHDAIETGLQQAVDLGHLLAFQLDPTLLLK
jgi:hypothetical protein